MAFNTYKDPQIRNTQMVSANTEIKLNYVSLRRCDYAWKHDIDPTRIEGIMVGRTWRCNST